MHLKLWTILLLHHGVIGMEFEIFQTMTDLVKQRITEMAAETYKEGLVLTKKSDLALRYMADTVVTTTLMGCLKLIPNKVDIPPLDLNLNMGGPGHLLTGKGQLVGLSSVKVRPIVYAFDSNGYILITFPITFTDLHIVYEEFQLDNWPIVMAGSSDLKFTDSEVDVNIRLTKPMDILENIANRKCVFHVGSIEFSGFHEMVPNIKLDGNSDHQFLTEHVFPVVAAAIKRVMLHMVDVRVTNSLYDSLPPADNWVCRDPSLRRLTLQTTGPVTFTPTGVAHWLPVPTESGTQELQKSNGPATLNFE